MLRQMNEAEKQLKVEQAARNKHKQRETELVSRIAQTEKRLKSQSKGAEKKFGAGRDVLLSRISKVEKKRRQ